MDNNHNNKFKKYEALRKLSHSGNKGYGEEDSGLAKKTQTNQSVHSTDVILQICTLYY